MRPVLTRTIVATLVVAVVLVLAGIAFGVTPEQRKDVRRADAAARSFRAEFTTFQNKADAAIMKKASKKLKTYADLGRYTQDWIDKAPALPVGRTTAYGRQHSKTWNTVADQRFSTLQQYRGLITQVNTRGVPIGSFVTAAFGVLDVQPSKILAGKPSTGAVLRSDVRPAFEKAKSKLTKQKAHADQFHQQQLYSDLQSYLKKALKQTDEGATKLDTGQSFFFSLGKKAPVLYQQIKALSQDLSTYMLGRARAATVAS